MKWIQTAAAIMAAVTLASPQSALAVQSRFYIDSTDTAYLRGIRAAENVLAGDVVRWLETETDGTAAVRDAAGHVLGENVRAATGQTAYCERGQWPEIVLVVSGDVIGTGTFSLSQVVAMVKGLTGGFRTEAARLAADLNGDGKISLSDIVNGARLLNDDAEKQPCPDSTRAAQTAELVNQIRKEAGREPLAVNQDLNRAAQVRVSEVIASGKLSHTRPDGRKCTTVFGGPDLKGENLARVRGYPENETVQATVKALQNSASHLKNMCLECYSQMGAAYAEGSDGMWYSCHVFASDGEVAWVDDIAEVRSRPKRDVFAA